MICIIMGVSGSGKTTTGRLLVQELGWAFHDADDFHSAANVAKMRSGQPLTDADRASWLAALARGLAAWESEGGAVLACSALKEQYRVTLQDAVPSPIRWVVLEGAKEVIATRLCSRAGHFMGPELLESQLAAFENPSYGLHLPAELPSAQQVQAILSYLAPPLNRSKPPVLAALVVSS